jgi:hypothetical protein
MNVLVCHVDLSSRALLAYTAPEKQLLLHSDALLLANLANLYEEAP